MAKLPPLPSHIAVILGAMNGPTVQDISVFVNDVLTFMETSSIFEEVKTLVRELEEKSGVQGRAWPVEMPQTQPGLLLGVSFRLKERMVSLSFRSTNEQATATGKEVLADLQKSVPLAVAYLHHAKELGVTQ